MIAGILIADSSSPHNNVDHLYFDIPSDGTYALRVNFLGLTYDLNGASLLADDYAIAWSIPEPASLTLLALSAATLLLRRRKKKRGFTFAPAERVACAYPKRNRRLPCGWEKTG